VKNLSTGEAVDVTNADSLLDVMISFCSSIPRLKVLGSGYIRSVKLHN
jgi:hypothetical protein